MRNYRSNVKFEYLTPIVHEEITPDAIEAPDKKEFSIKGTAINATTTRNGNVYSIEELRGSGKSLRGKPILVDHINSVDKIAGIVTRAEYDEAKQAVMFEGVIKDARYKEMIADGRVQNVSVGAMVETAEEITDETTGKTNYLLKGIEFLEVSLVAIPADPNANFAASVSEAFKLNEEIIVKQTLKEEPKVTENKQEDILAATLKALSDSVSAIAEKVSKLEATPAPAPKTEAVDETKGVVVRKEESKDTETTTDNLMLTKNEKNFGRADLSYKSYEGTAFKRLQHKPKGDY